MHLDQIQKTVVSGFVFRQFPLIGNAHGLSPTWRYAARPVGHVRVTVVEVEQARCQAHGQVRGCHLVVGSVARYVVQEIEQSLQRFPVLVRQKQQHALHRVRPQINRYICNNYGTPVIIIVPMFFLYFVDKSLALLRHIASV